MPYSAEVNKCIALIDPYLCHAPWSSCFFTIGSRSTHNLFRHDHPSLLALLIRVEMLLCNIPISRELPETLAYKKKTATKYITEAVDVGPVLRAD